jgi:hypothetical protein
MIKLTDILYDRLNLREGALVTFDQTGKAVGIEINTNAIPGEQLVFSPGQRRIGNLKVYYSLKSNPKESSPKQSQDAIKNSSELLDKVSLKQVVKETLLPDIQLSRITHLLVLGSSQGLTENLGTVLQELCPNAKLIPVSKTQYKFIDNAVDWESYQKLGKGSPTRMQRDIQNYLDKRAKTEGPYTIKKTGELQSSLLRHFHTKYDVGLNPYLPDYKTGDIYNIFEQAVNGTANILIIDDNIHEGLDFTRLFKGIQEIYKQLSNNLRQSISNKQIDIKTVDLMSKLLANYSERIHGYVLYKLENTDIVAKTRKSDSDNYDSITQIIIDWYKNHPDPKTKAQEKYVTRGLEKLKSEPKLSKKAYQEKIKLEYPMPFQDRDYSKGLKVHEVRKTS